MLLLLFVFSVIIPSMLTNVNSTKAQSEVIPMRLTGYRETSLPGNTEVLASIYIPLRNVNLLYSYAEQVTNPGSPIYHKFLSPSQVASMFYPVTEFSSVMSYLIAHHVKIVFTAADSVIVVKGTASQLSQVLGIHYLLMSNGTTQYYTAIGTPKISGIVISSNVSAIFFSHPTTLFTQADVEKLMNTLEQPNQTFPIEGYKLTDLHGVYNVSSLLARGVNGTNYTVGILDFYGDPYIQQQLAYFDKIYQIPAPPNFTVVPIGPYNPNLGITTGWAGEISLDVESAHAMAPGANIVLYIANPNLPLSSVIAQIVSQDRVDTLSQSFSIPDEFFPGFSGPTFYECVVLSDQYYAMGSAEGITFLASSGDGGGSGYSAGPLGTVGYPATSPFVTAMGGTTTYLTFDGFSFNVTAWSNYGFVPPNVNFGGSSGGISQVEPKPYYQWDLTTPRTYPNGREIPDISANADVYPGIFIVCPGNVTEISGGTSEASPLTAGLLTLVMQYDHSRLGNINPDLYYLSKVDPAVFYPITFGYNIPWTASQGYNLVTGLGQLNVGNLATAMKKIPSSLSVMVNVSNTTVIPGQRITVEANVTLNGTPVTAGQFQVTLEGVNGNLTTVPLSYQNGEWTTSLTIPGNDSGVTYLTVWGTSGGISGYGMTELFSGYFVQFLSPVPYSTSWTGSGITIVANATTPSGSLSPEPTLQVDVYSYNITDNSYTLVNETILNYTPSVDAWVGSLIGDLPAGPLLLQVVNGFGYDAIFNGIGMSSMFILPPTVAEPGTVYPGQDIIVLGSLTPPNNLPSTTSLNLATGSNMTAELWNGSVISSATIPFSPAGEYLGYLKVPNKLSPGLYTVLLFSSYDSYTLNETIPGFYYGQIYVGSEVTAPLNFSSHYVLQGSTLYIYSNVTSQGKVVKYGMFSATVFPNILSDQYSAISTVLEVPLWYNSSIGLWVGNVTLPSTLSLGNLTYLGNSYFAEPFKVLVTGVSAYGGETSTNISHAGEIYVEPITLIKNDPSYSVIQTYDTAFLNDTIHVNGNMANDVFLGNDTIVDSNVVITSSNVTGTLVIENSHVTLVDAQVNRLILVNSSVKLVSSYVESIVETSSLISPILSRLINVYPEYPVIQIGVQPYQNLTGNVSIPITVAGSDVTNVTVELDGSPIATFQGNGTHTVSIDTEKYSDGTHDLTVIVGQSDGLSTSFAAKLVFENQLQSVSQKVNALNSTLPSTQGTAKTGEYLSIVGIVLALVAIVISLIRRR
ncbi:S8 family serine peptidase [Metallosphaera hakonensis JCM 8857 = DSM 7519]|uniref:Peptidase S8 n=1 Tax=Metallosphaera hakonensis JCM 8857 = DSM 7519 TaxID=1293036 RepID=A0A2U9IX39_9CREN|nr:S8 family serine peptidase [Metallosphaera hakonensis JCM 8857 = DSM 7519]